MNWGGDRSGKKSYSDLVVRGRIQSDACWPGGGGVWIWFDWVGPGVTALDCGGMEEIGEGATGSRTEESRAGFESVFHKIVLAVNAYCLLSHFHRDKL